MCAYCTQSATTYSFPGVSVPLGSDVHIREDFRKFVKDNQFERAAAAADATDLSLQQAAEREAHILKVSHARGVRFISLSDQRETSVRPWLDYCDVGRRLCLVAFRGRFLFRQRHESYHCHLRPMQVSTREDRSPRSFEAINRAASLFIVWMKLRVDLHESADRSEASIFYPSAFKVSVPFV